MIYMFILLPALRLRCGTVANHRQNQSHKPFVRTALDPYHFPRHSPDLNALSLTGGAERDREDRARAGGRRGRVRGGRS